MKNHPEHVHPKAAKKTRVPVKNKCLSASSLDYDDDEDDDDDTLPTGVRLYTISDITL